MITAEQRTIAFFESWSVSYDAMVTSFRKAFTADSVWDQQPLVVITGVDEVLRFLRWSRRAGIETVDVEMVHIASRGDFVFTERVDHLRREDGTLVVSAPMAGVLEWHDERIVRWRDYFDSVTLIGRALPRVVAGAARRASTRRN
jgi:limonene-1,2-epoxide hydrolase